VIDAYERLMLPGDLKVSTIFLYALHFEEANHLQVGFGTETKSGLNRAHIAGPAVHELHVPALAACLKQHKRVGLVGAPAPWNLQHPWSSTGNTVDGYSELLEEEPTLWLHVDRYEPLVENITVEPDLVDRFADLILRVRNKVWGNPIDWDFRHVELLDGRFLWLCYDSTIEKIRVGMGFHSPENEKQYGMHTYAIGKGEIAQFCAFHYLYLDGPIQFMGLPARWPHELSPFLAGEPKQDFAKGLLRLADEVWPGEITHEP